jgi:hypothetical protein
MPARVRFRAAVLGGPGSEGLGPFYDVFERYLGDDAVYGPRVKRWRERWDQRKEDIRQGRDRWPKFLFKTETTFDLVRSPAT